MRQQKKRKRGHTPQSMFLLMSSGIRYLLDKPGSLAHYLPVQLSLTAWHL
jgi:hypothetical protein